jgi:hypothetical protein
MFFNTVIVRDCYIFRYFGIVEYRILRHISRIRERPVGALTVSILGINRTNSGYWLHIDTNRAYFNSEY